MERLLEGKRAVVTGAARGIGREFAFALANAGASVVLADINKAGAAQAAAEIAVDRGQTISCVLDQGDPDSVQAMAETVEAELGGVDILVNNAALFGGLQRKDALDITIDEWHRVVSINLTGVYLCCRAALPMMIRQEYGKIVNISSSSIYTAQNRLAHYVAAKSGVIGLTRALAREYSCFGITINALSPGSTDSGTVASTADYLQSRVASRSIPRVEVPGDLVGTLLFLSSPMSDFMTGQNLVCDGGAIFH